MAPDKTFLQCSGGTLVLKQFEFAIETDSTALSIGEPTTCYAPLLPFLGEIATYYLTTLARILMQHKSRLRAGSWAIPRWYIRVRLRRSMDHDIPLLES